MITAVKPQRVQTRIAQQHHRQRRGRWIAFEDGTNVLSYGPDDPHTGALFSRVLRSLMMGPLEILSAALPLREEPRTFESQTCNLYLALYAIGDVFNACTSCRRASNITVDK